MKERVWPPRIYRHKSGQDRVRIDGRDIYLGKSGSDEAKAAYARLVADLAAGRQPEAVARAQAQAGDASVRDVVAAWWSERAGRYSERGREAVQFRLSLRPLIVLYGPTPAAAFSLAELESLRMAMASGSWMSASEVEKASKNWRQIRWCASVCNRRCGRIKTVWRWAEQRGLVPEGRWAHLCSLPAFAGNDASVRHSESRAACSEGELKLVADCCPRPVAAMLRLMWWTGARPGEIRIMRACDVDQSAEVWTYRPTEHKNDWRGQERVILIGPEAQRVLLPFLLESEGEQHVFRPTGQTTHTHYGSSTLSQAVRRAALEAGVPGFEAYQCRHAAKKRIAEVHGLEVARAILGQKSVQTTERYSQQQDVTLASDAAKKSG